MRTAGRIAGGAAAIGLVAGGLYAATRLGVGPLDFVQPCEATVGGHTVELSQEQAENASLIAAIGVRRGLPARAVSIALATAYQESKIRNIEHGDRDSLGLFQQRPSQGWGTEEQILDPYYSINKFYDGLVKIEGYESMRITEAAQAVQRSGFPEAYEDHAEDARALASALTGHSADGQFSCKVSHRGLDSEPDELDASGLTGRAATVRADIEAAFGDLPMGGFQPGGLSEGHKDGSAHYEGRAVDIFFRPVNPANNLRGWSLAYYLVAQADRLGIETVIYDDMIWTARRSGSGWRDYDEPDRPGDKAVLRHLDHVHVDVAD